MKDGGENYEFLEGDDVFIVLRASGAAESGDRFKVQVPQDAFEFSVYQSPDVDLNVDVGWQSFVSIQFSKCRGDHERDCDWFSESSS